MNASRSLGALCASSASRLDSSSDNYFREDIANSPLLISDRGTIILPLLKIAGVAVRVGVVVFMCMFMFVAVAVFMVVVVSVVVSVTSQNHEAQQVGEEAGTANDQNELRVVDLGGFNEASQGFEDDGDAKRD